MLIPNIINQGGETMKILSISVAAYNAEKYIERCLNSFIDERILDAIEILVIDDGGTDRTLSIVKSYEEKYPSTIKAVHKENGGHGSTINTAISLATGEYFKIVDSDDWVDTQSLCSLVEELKTTNADMVLNPYKTVVDGTTKEEVIYPFNSRDITVPVGKDFTIEEIAENLTLPMHSITFRTSILKNSKYRMSEHCFYVDSEYTSYYVSKVIFVRYLKDVLYCYRIGANEQSVSFESMQRRRNEHLKVCLNVLDFYLKNRDTMNHANEIVVRRRVIDLINAQYKIILSLPSSKDSLKELKELFAEISSRSNSFLEESLEESKKLGYNMSKFASFLYNHNFLFVDVINAICRRKFS